MYPHNNISQTVTDLSFIDYGSSSGKWRANKKIKFDPVSFYQSGLILSGKDYFKKSFGNNSDNRFDDFLVEFYGTGNNYEIDFTKNGQNNLSIERTGNSNGGFLLNYRGSPTSFSETGATGFYSFNFKNTGSSAVNIFVKGSGTLVYLDDRVKTPNGYFASGVFINTTLTPSGFRNRLVSINNSGISTFNLDSFSIDFLCKFTGDRSSYFDFLSTRTNSGSVNYPGINAQNSLTFFKYFDSNRIILSQYTSNILTIPITSGSWDHIMVTCNKVGNYYNFSGYRNGILESSNSASFGSFNWANNLFFSGLDIHKSSYNGQPGYIFLDEIRMWSGAKSSGEINNLKFTELKSDPLLYNDPNLLYYVSFDGYTQNKNIEFYKNGNLLKTNTINNIYTGYLDYSNIKVTGNFEIDEFRFWSGIRTSGQISQNAKSGIGVELFPSFRGGAYGKINPTMTVNTKTALTESGYFTSGFMIHSGVDPAWSIQGAVNVFGNNVRLKSLTMDFLIKTKSSPNYYDTSFFLTPKLTAPSSDVFTFYWENNPGSSEISFAVAGSNNSALFPVSFEIINDTWNHVYVTIEELGSRWYSSIYLNGTGPIQQTSFFTGIYYGSHYNFNGVRFHYNGFNTAISGNELILDEVRVWSGVKSTQEMNQLRFKRLSSRSDWMNDPNLLFYTPFSSSEVSSDFVSTGKLSDYQNSGLYSYPLI
jgi:hypothetical protein